MNQKESLSKEDRAILKEFLGIIPSIVRSMVHLLKDRGIQLLIFLGVGILIGYQYHDLDSKKQPREVAGGAPSPYIPTNPSPAKNKYNGGKINERQPVDEQQEIINRVRHGLKNGEYTK